MLFIGVFLFHFENNEKLVKKNCEEPQKYDLQTQCKFDKLVSWFFRWRNIVFKHEILVFLFPTLVF